MSICFREWTEGSDLRFRSGFNGFSQRRFGSKRLVSSFGIFHEEREGGNGGAKIGSKRRSVVKLFGKVGRDESEKHFVRIRTR